MVGRLLSGRLGSRLRPPSVALAISLVVIAAALSAGSQNGGQPVVEAGRAADGPRPRAPSAADLAAPGKTAHPFGLPVTTPVDGSPPSSALPAGGPGTDQPAAEFPIGWYDSLLRRSSLPAIARDGMDAVLPYDSQNGEPDAYLDDAHRSGVKVMLEMPRRFVKSVDRAMVRHFVTTHRDHPALLGWYLADEPSVNRDVGPLSPENAKVLYEVIKSADGAHPVAIAFGGREDPAPYSAAMDLMMFDRYPCWAGQPEFSGLPGWRVGLRRAALVARTEDGFIPILQAYAHRSDEHLLTLRPRHRLPTRSEMRYMAFTALLEDATGMFFWARYRSDAGWIDAVLRPIVSRIGEMGAALAGGPSRDLVRVTTADVQAGAFRHPVTGAVFVVSVNHGEAEVSAPVQLRGSLAGAGSATLLSDPPRTVPVRGAVIEQKLGAFAVTVYRL